MVESDHSDTPDDVDTKLSNLDESTDSIHLSNKRQHEESSSDESLNLPKKRCISVEEEAMSVKAPENSSVSESNGPKEEGLERGQEPIENGKSIYLCTEKTNTESKESHIVGPEAKENTQSDENKKKSEKESDDDHSSDKPASSENDVNIHEKPVEKEDSENTDLESEKEDKNADAFKKDNIRSSQSKDAEVVDGLELSVECASDKEGSSSNSDTDTEAKPRPKTIIIKAKPNESELDISSSEAEKSDKHESKDVTTIKKDAIKGKKKDARKALSKPKTSGSEDSLDNNSDDEDYNPSNRKKLKKSPMTRKLTKSQSDAKKGQGYATKKKSQETNSSKDANNDIKDKDKNNDVHEDPDDDKINNDDDNDGSDNSNIEDTDITDKTNKSVSKEKKKVEQNLSSNESSDDKSEDDEKDDESQTRRKRSTKPEDNKKIVLLKRYIRTAGITVKSYQELWAGCKTNTARVKQLQKLLKKHGVEGRLTLAKCKKAKANNERLKEISELDKRNIISEGRVTRARKSKDNEDTNKKSVTTSNTPTRHREMRNTYKRIQNIIDSDSE